MASETLLSEKDGPRRAKPSVTKGSATKKDPIVGPAPARELDVRPPSSSKLAVLDVAHRLRHLERALRRETDPDERAMLVDQIVVVYISRVDVIRAMACLEELHTPPSDVNLRTRIDSLRLIVRSMASETYDVELVLENLGLCNPSTQALVLQRLGGVGYFSRDVQMAQRFSLQAVALSEDAGLYKLAAQACMTLYVCAYQITGDLADAQFWIERTALFASEAGDATLKRIALVVQYDLAAVLGQVERARSLQEVLRRNPSSAQFSETLSGVVPDAFLLALDGEFDAMHRMLANVLRWENLGKGDHVLLRGLDALAIAGIGDRRLARSRARQAISLSSAAVPPNELALQATRRQLGRVLAAATSMLVGDKYDARRALQSKTLENGPITALARAIAEDRLDIQNPGLRLVRGYAMLINAISARQDVENTLLTPAECDALRHLSKGLEYETIAEYSGKSVNTIKNQLKSAYRKLHAVNRVQAIQTALKLNLL